jgi:hypothetical protein
MIERKELIGVKPNRAFTMYLLNLLKGGFNAR